MRHMHVLDWLLLCAAIAFIGALATHVADNQSSVMAWHKNGHVHMNSLHSSLNHEDVCVRVNGGSISFATARDRIKNTLYIDNTAEDWDDLAGRRVYFIVNPTTCAQLNPTVYNNTEVEYIVLSEAQAEQQCGTIGGQPVSCAALGYQMQSAGHWDYRYGYAWLQASRLSATPLTYHHLVNHETGHMLGLADPGAGDPHYHCLYSVMHSIAYGCGTSHEWPTYSDRASVESIATNP